MFSFQTNNPYATSIKNSENLSWFSAIFNWFSSIESPSSSASIGTLILPAQDRASPIITERKIKQLEESYNVRIQTGIVKTYDQAELETIEISPVTIKPKRHIISFNGNGALYQDSINAYISDAKTLNAKIIGFNYRGVGSSKKQPKNYQDLITDGIAQVQRLLDNGVPCKNILLDGHSLGGSIATMVAKHFHTQNQPIHLWNDRSFATMAKAAAGIVASSTSLEPPLATSSYAALGSTGWNPNVANAYNAIPASYKGYMFASKKSGNNKGDGVISHAASLHRSVKFFEEKQVIKTGTRLYTKVRAPAHNMPRSELVNKEGDQTGQQVFENFVNTHIPSF